MTKSALPMARKTLMSWTPMVPPITPPMSSRKPHLEVDVAQPVVGIGPGGGGRHDLVGVLAAATVEGMPAMISRGVMRKPPPTPKSPERKPTAPPRPKSSKMLIALPEIGR